MLDIGLVCVGKLKESYYIHACDEYLKRLGAHCKVSVTEITEQRNTERCSAAQIKDALEREGEAIAAALPAIAYVIVLCVEGKQTDSVSFAQSLSQLAARGRGKICFVIGGSNGLSEKVKQRADQKLSLSQMTLPHHLARVVLLEQLYRAMNINSGGKYHK